MENRSTGRRKFLYLMLSILVAVAIWLVSELTGGLNGTPRTRSQEFKAIPIEYISEGTLADRGLMLLEDGSDMTIDLKLQGTRWMLAQLDRSQIRVTANLFNVVNAGTQTINYTVSYTDRKFYSLDYEASISSATVNISELYSRSVDVSCELVGNVAEGCTAGQVELSQSTIEIRGQAEDIDLVRFAWVTLDIGEDAEETVSQELEIQYYDSAGNLLDKSGIHADLEVIRATMPVYVTKELGLTVSFTDAPGARLRNTNYRIEPSTITVSGDATLLKNMETLNLGEFDLLDLGTNASENYTTTYYQIILPDGCQNLSGVSRAALKIRFTDMHSTTVTTSNITWRNLPENRNAEILTETLAIRIFGTAANVGAVTGDHISAAIDLTDYSAASGTYTVPATVTIAAGDVGITGEYQVQVNIQEKEETLPSPEDEELQDGEPAEE